MVFSIGASSSRSRSNSSSESDAYGYSGSTSGSISGGSSIATGQSTSRQNIAFEDIFAKLYDGASNAAFSIDPSALTSQANSLFLSGNKFLDSLGGGADTDYLTARMSGESPVLQEQIDSLGADLGRFFDEQINPTITSQGVATGTLGGGRQGVAQGMAADSLARVFSRGVTGLRTADVQARDNAAATLGQNRLQGAATGLQGVTGLTGVAQFASQAGLDPYVSLANILGGPTTLTQGQSTDFATSEDFARAFSKAFAEDFAHSESKSSSSSKSKSFSFGLSDRRLKSNIKKIGELANGLNLYSYTIFGNDEIGVMADEVAEVIPEAVATHESGYLMVDYAQVMS